MKRTLFLVKSRIDDNGERTVHYNYVVSKSRSRCGMIVVNHWHKEVPGCAVKVIKMTEVGMDGNEEICSAPDTLIELDKSQPQPKKKKKKPLDITPKV